MAKLTESYLRGMIKQVMNEMQGQGSFKQTIGTNLHDLVEFVGELQQMVQSSQNDKELALDIRELVSRYHEDLALNSLVSVLANHLEQESEHLLPQQGEHFSEEEMEDYDLYESRKSKATPKRK